MKKEVKLEMRDKTAKHNDMIEIILLALRLIANDDLFFLRSVEITLPFDEPCDAERLSEVLFISDLIAELLIPESKMVTTTFFCLKNSFK